MPEKFYQQMQYSPIYITPQVANNPQILKELTETCVKKISKQIEVYRGALSKMRVAAKNPGIHEITSFAAATSQARLTLINMMADLEIVLDKYYGK